ncbi:hypothetical protein HanRHA438_Chr16g0745821 [Helianthus annuus]|uniref:Uncharacterized protein n=1 Tax=Helianthus annuus TaxID=4232 RepID=A0A251RXE0_HELAN|nr:hypothetical protein HanXRQr2_Chr16g0733401 [Helianthus annuus]KAJ0820071.1 hypothetical protein HanPSC8_Chr16g0703521 [Helianthus annuus]KAJ0834630.1 hypothetical protein HanRHA438_Chr16g0745821 [Helianthus annuus]
MLSSLHFLFRFRITPISSPDVLPSHQRFKKPSQHGHSRFDCWRSRKDLNLADLLQI